MSTARSRTAVLDAEFLEMRAWLLQLAAGLDRIDRAEGNVQNDPRMERLREGMELLLSSDSNRAEQVQLAFSRPYQSEWRQQFELTPR